MPLCLSKYCKYHQNAAESIEADGEIIVRTLAPATVEVIDNGQGISKETEAKLFSPFFSTKPNGQESDSSLFAKY